MRKHKSGCYSFLRIHKEFATNCGNTGAFFSKGGRVSTWTFHSQHLIFITSCGCTQGGAEDRKSTDPEEDNHEL